MRLIFDLVYFVALFYTCSHVVIANADDIEMTTVGTKVGTFVGYVYKSETFGKAFSNRRFLRIPYAQPPVGDLRFKKPVRMGKLSQPYDATKYGPLCMQQEIELGGSRKPGLELSISMSEDCLFLNIYTPNEPISANEKLPVMIFFHGGGFVIGSPNLFPGDILATYGKVIFVTVAYRLSIWGFLSTGDEHLLGNYGLWDQHMAIQWVHENIANFGGDSESITLIGNSAGGASVIYQSMYPGNKGLVKRGISHSGTVTSPWAFNPDPLTPAKRLARLVGCDTQQSTRELAECLKSKSTEELGKALNKRENGFIRFPMEFLPSVDQDFLPESPKTLFHSVSEIAKQYRNALSSIDLMTGAVSNEGLMMIIPFVGVWNTESYEADRNKLEHELVPEVLRVVFGEKVPDILRSLVINEYTNWDDPDNSFNSRESYITLSSDYVFNIQIMETALLHTTISEKNTYVYLYDAFPSQHLLEAPSWANKPQHGDDFTTLLGYDNKGGFTLWTTPYPTDPPDKWELELSKTHITMWSNFAKSGNPNKPTDVKPLNNSVWPTYDAKSQRYLNISRHMSENSVGQRLFARASNFWYNVLPGMLDAVQGSSETGEKNYCERDGGCSP